MFKLSFKKLHLFCSKIIALGVEHRGGGISRIKHARGEKIKIWPIPEDNSDVRSFMASINITKSWIKNFAEMAAPLNYLTGNVPFIWGPVQQASFSLLRDKCSSEVEKHGPLPNVPCQMYSDASNWCMGCVITQFQEQGTIKRNLEVPILYDSINLISSQRNYGTYKRELLAIVTFARKYDYLFRAHETSIIFTDHKPLAFFLDSARLDGIYARWNHLLCELNVEIVWISGKRNEIADALSRTLFLDPTNERDAVLEEYGAVVQDGKREPEWVWKDGKGGYVELIERHHAARRAMTTDTTNLVGTNTSDFQSTVVESSTVEFSEASQYLDPVEQHLCRVSSNAVDLTPVNKNLQSSAWFGQIYNFHRTNVPPPGLDRLKKRAFLIQARRHRLVDTNLFVEINGIWKRCVPESEVSAVLYAAHDEAGHHAARLTMRKLREYYWPRLAKDTHDYILGCMYCAKHGTARRSQSQSSPSVSQKMALLGMDFIGPLPQAKLSVEESIRCCFPQFSECTTITDDPPENGFTSSQFTHIFLVIDYFSRFVWAFPVSAANQTEAIRCLIWLFEIWGPPGAIYSDIGTHFSGAKMQQFLSNQNVLWIPAPSGSKRSTGMAEK
ncbi:hypothetical protein K3495_g15001, partial [Podosphaera aphanis]